ncbi:MAG: ChaN family lipoprotein [Desulfobacterales bacterium]
MRQILCSAALAVLLLGSGCASSNKNVTQRVYDVDQEMETTLAKVIPQLKNDRIVLVGEHHTDENHHLMQLQVIRQLHEAGVRLAIGMEMFRRDSQPDLDLWVAGKIDEPAFEKIYDANWSYPWHLYRPILLYARENRIPVIGLNIPGAITRQVARSGYQSLSEEQRSELGHVTCRVDKDYMDFIRQAFGGHAHGDLNFIYFCEAQMVWDTVMAVTALDYIERHPNTVMVILAGTGHVRKQAIATQIRDRAAVPLSVFLPEEAGSIEKDLVDRKDADYVWLSP